MVMIHLRQDVVLTLHCANEDVKIAFNSKQQCALAQPQKATNMSVGSLVLNKMLITSGFLHNSRAGAANGTIMLCQGERFQRYYLTGGSA